MFSKCWWNTTDSCRLGSKWTSKPCSLWQICQGRSLHAEFVHLLFGPLLSVASAQNSTHHRAKKQSENHVKTIGWWWLWFTKWLAKGFSTASTLIWPMISHCLMPNTECFNHFGHEVMPGRTSPGSCQLGCNAPFWVESQALGIFYTWCQMVPCIDWLVVWNINFMIFHILGMSSSQLTFIFFRGVETTNQMIYMVINIL